MSRTALLGQSQLQFRPTWQDRWQRHSSFSSAASADASKKNGDRGQGSEPNTGSAQQSNQQGGEAKASGTAEDEVAEREALMGQLAEKELELQEKTEQVDKLKDTVLRTYAEMENLRSRTRRDMDASRKFAIQNFAKELLDVGDNLARAVGVVPEQFRQPGGNSGEAAEDDPATKLLRTLVEGVLMTENQLLKVFKKHGLEQFDPTGEVFDPNVHNAVFEVPDPSKPPGTVAMVMKTGYKLHDRVIRPAEVGVVKDPSS